LRGNVEILAIWRLEIGVLIVIVGILRFKAGMVD
jgi:hypothetical protein